ncbi:MAG: chemotaxis protein CheW [Limisphaerales bacterium]
MMMTPADTFADTAAVDRCWSEIGVWGDRTCPELRGWVHCHNCPVFSRAGRRLFERPPPEDYVQEWTRLLAAERPEEIKEQVSVMVFRLGDEWLALPTQLFREIAENRPIHRIPHRTNKVLLGLVNIRGGLQPCFSLRELLGVPESDEHAAEPWRKNGARLAVVEKAGAGWVFPVDEIAGIQRFPQQDLQNLPVTVAKASASFTKGIFTTQNRRIGQLDDELVFYHLKRTVL